MQETTGVLAENTMLIGVKRVERVVEIRDDLAGRLGCPNPTAAKVTAFFKDLPTHEEAITESVVARYLRIHTRFSQATNGLFALEVAESVWSKHHALAGTTTLDALRQDSLQGYRRSLK